ncbi:FIST N-terminal domain-containing protein [Nocardia xishanensis]|uniref:FIST N-terminal domain-containing protein n=1 Tax=Nocardia xishanensis TaxID=238964 RepID=A0ABW7WT81_9NOCA
MQIAVGLSTAPDSRHAGVEAATRARDQLAGASPSLAVLLASRGHANAASAVLEGVHQSVRVPALIGCVARGVLAGRSELEDQSAVAVWLAAGPRAETFRLNFVRTAAGGLLAGHRFDRASHDFHLLLSDPFTFPTEALLEHLNTDKPGTMVMGGLASGGPGPGESRLFCDHEVVVAGAVGVRLPGLRSVPVVSQGCRPIGQPYIVTEGRGALITKLGGRSPIERLREIFDVLPPDQQELVAQGVQIGIVVDERLDTPEQGDFLIRGLLGADPASGAIEIGEEVEIGTTVQFQVRDAVGADRDLRAAVAQARSTLHGRPAGALLFTCNGRGTRMFGVADHDTTTIEDLLGDIPLAGFFAAGEIGPIAGRNALHGFTASLALFGE